jgi:organic hydroperoxide reductase OsmC/OhrA
MTKEHQYSVHLEWTGNTGTGTSTCQSYERSHTITAENKQHVLCSSDPAFRGDATKYNPEELFVAAIANCHMLWFLHLAATAGIIVVSYKDQPIGVMMETDDGGGHFVNVTLHPVIVITDETMIEQANALHHKAHQYCFIANSCNFPIEVKPTCNLIES